MSALRRAHADGRRLQEALDAEYRAAQRENTWGRTQPQIVERWRVAVRAWIAGTDAALAGDSDALARLRAAPPATHQWPGESPAWVEIRNAVAGRLAVLGALLEQGPDESAPPPRSPWRRR